MTKILATAWVKALRSGKFKQGIGSLLSNYGETPHHCCLGVLAVVCRTRAAFKGDNLSDSRIRNKPDLTEICIREKVGLTPEQERMLIARNDGEAYKDKTTQWSFKQIADWVEQTFVRGKK